MPYLGKKFFMTQGKKTMLDTLDTQPLANDFYKIPAPEVVQDFVAKVKWVCTHLTCKIITPANK